ncbi:MAG: hypothetical protein ACR2P3_07835, partial [Geminicoccaceae bacterium]
MRYLTPCLALLATIGMATAAGGQSLEELINQFQSDAPKVEAEVQIDAWVEPGDSTGEADEMVITLLPGGQTKLNA